MSRLLRATHLWFLGAEFDLDDVAALDDPRALLLASVATGWTTEPPHDRQQAAGLGPPIERAFRALATQLGVAGDPLVRETARRAVFRTGTPPHLVTSIDNGRNGVTVTAKGDVDAVLPRCTQLLDDQGRAVPLTPDARLHLRRAVTRHAANGRPVVAVAHRALGVGHPVPTDRRQAETDLILIGLVAMADPFRTVVAEPPAPRGRPPENPPIRRTLRPSPLHQRGGHRGGVSDRLSALRAGVLGANDGIVSVAALMTGVAAVTASRTVLLTAGIAGLVAGSVSMAGGEYLSVNSGLAQDLVRRGYLAGHDALATSPEAELGIDSRVLTRAWPAVWVSMPAFASGALLPLLVILLAPTWKVGSCFVAVGVALTATGVISARVDGASRTPVALRTIGVAAIAMALTYGVGIAVRLLI